MTWLPPEADREDHPMNCPGCASLQREMEWLKIKHEQYTVGVSERANAREAALKAENARLRADLERYADIMAKASVRLREGMCDLQGKSPALSGAAKEAAGDTRTQSLDRRSPVCAVEETVRNSEPDHPLPQSRNRTHAHLWIDGKCARWDCDEPVPPAEPPAPAKEEPPSFESVRGILKGVYPEGMSSEEIIRRNWNGDWDECGAAPAHCTLAPGHEGQHRFEPGSEE